MFMSWKSVTDLQTGVTGTLARKKAIIVNYLNITSNLRLSIIIL
jgi:hypothetical protein